MTGEEVVQDAPIPEQAPEEYAIVEIFGHRRHVGRVFEVNKFGAVMLRVDEPKAGGYVNGWVSHFYGGGSIFSFRYTSKAAVDAYHAGAAVPVAGLLEARFSGRGGNAYDHEE